MKRYLLTVAIAIIIAATCIICTACSSGNTVGDTVTFGVYDRNDFGTEMTTTDYGWSTPIEWIVVEDNDGLLTLLSKDILWQYDYFSDAFGQKNFEKSILKKDLNNAFYNTAFTEDEKASMGYFPLNEDGTDYDCNVVIPSHDDVMTWFSTNDERKATMEGGPAGPYDLLFGGIVMQDGSAESSGNSLGHGVRPLICVDKKYLSDRGEQKVEKKEKYNTVDVGGLSFKLPIVLEENKEASEDEVKIYNCNLRGDIAVLLVLYSEDAAISDTEFSDNLDQLIKKTYEGNGFSVSDSYDYGKEQEDWYDYGVKQIKNNMGFTTYRSHEWEHMGGNGYSVWAYLINNTTDEKLVKVLLIQRDLAEGSDEYNNRAVKTCDKIVKKATLSEKGGSSQQSEILNEAVTKLPGDAYWGADLDAVKTFAELLDAQSCELDEHEFNYNSYGASYLGYECYIEWKANEKWTSEDGSLDQVSISIYFDDNPGISLDDLLEKIEKEYGAQSRVDDNPGSIAYVWETSDTIIAVHDWKEGHAEGYYWISYEQK